MERRFRQQFSTFWFVSPMLFGVQTLFGGRAVVSGSYTSFPGRQPVASSFLQHSPCYGTGSGGDLPVPLFQESLKGKSMTRTDSSGCTSPKPQRQRERLLPSGGSARSHPKPQMPLCKMPRGDAASATSSGSDAASARTATGQPAIGLNQPAPLTSRVRFALF